MRVEREWNIPRGIQRWILGKQLATDDSKTLEEHGVVDNSCPLFLYIVTPGNGNLQRKVKAVSEALTSVQHFRKSGSASGSAAEWGGIPSEERKNRNVRGSEKAIADYRRGQRKRM